MHYHPAVGGRRVPLVSLDSTMVSDTTHPGLLGCHKWGLNHVRGWFDVDLVMAYIVNTKKIVKRKQTLKFTVDCSQPVDDGTMDALHAPPQPRPFAT